MFNMKRYREVLVQFVELLIMHAGMWICYYGNYYRIHFLNNQFGLAHATGVHG